MKILKLTTLILILALTACQANTQKIGTNMNSKLSTQETYQKLAINEILLSGTWQLQDNELKGSDNKPLTLNFNQGQVSVLNGCNHLSANYQITDNRLTIASPMSTRMMCEPNLMQIDDLATQLFGGNIRLEKGVDNLAENTYLKIMTNDKTYQFIKVK